MLSGGLALWLEIAFESSILDTSILTCKVFSFLTYTMSDFAVLIIVIMTAEKLFAISCPFQAYQSKLDWKKSSITATIAFIFCAFINSHFIITHSLISMNDSLTIVLTDLQNYYFNENFTISDSIFEEIKNKNSRKQDLFCSYTQWDGFYNNYWPYIDASIYSFIPFAVLSIFNILIVRRIIKIEREHSKLIEVQKSSKLYSYADLNDKSPIKTKCDSSSRKVLKIRIISKNTSAFKVIVRSYLENENCKYTKTRQTLTLILINVSFCLFSMPIVALGIFYYNNKTKIVDYITNHMDHELHNVFKQFDLLKTIAELLQYLNHSVNFFLYCISGRKFRKETLHFLKNFKRM